MTDREVMQMALETLDNMAKVDWREWDEFASVEDFVRWAKSRASFTAEALRTALAQPEQEPVAWKALVGSVRQMRDVQGMVGNWNFDPYRHGLFNGIEFALSLIEVRAPKFRDAPEKWLCDEPKARLFSEEKNNG